jgi:exodeoxyribonuclease VIII
MKPAIGIHIGMSFEEYRSLDAINFHTLWSLREKSPADAQWEFLNGTTETESLAFGSLTDFVLLEPARFIAEAAVEPEIGEGEGKAPKRPTARQVNAKNPSKESLEAIRFWDQWDAVHASKIVVKRSDYTRVLEIGEQVRSLQCREYICGGRSQVCLVWNDPQTGLLCKARLDYEQSAGLNHIITDLKTSRSAHPDFWKWAIQKYGYFMQLAWYDWGWNMVTGDTSICGWLIAQTQGFCGVVYRQAHEETIEAGWLAFRVQLDRWAELVKKNDWPFYPTDIVNMDRWALEREGVSKYIIWPEKLAGPTPRPEADTFEAKYGLE